MNDIKSTSRVRGEWNMGLLMCCTSHFCMTAFRRPSKLHEQCANRIGEDGNLYKMAITTPCSAGRLRGKIRKAYGIPGSAIQDHVIATFCGPCATVQQTEQCFTIFRDRETEPLVMRHNAIQRV